MVTGNSLLITFSVYGSAVLAFQKSKGLLADGIVGLITLGALKLTKESKLPSVINKVTTTMVSKMFP